MQLENSLHVGADVAAPVARFHGRVVEVLHDDDRVLAGSNAHRLYKLPLALLGVPDRELAAFTHGAPAPFLDR